MSDIEGKVTRVGASERGQRTSFNGANGMSDIEGKVTRVGASERGQRTSFNFAHLSGFWQSFWKRGSLRSGSQSGLIRRSPHVSPLCISSRCGKAAIAESI